MANFDHDEFAPRGNPAHQTAASRRILRLEADLKHARNLLANPPKLPPVGHWRRWTRKVDQFLNEDSD